MKKTVTVLFGTLLVVCLLAADLAPYQGLVAKYGTRFDSLETLAFVAANVHGLPYSHASHGQGGTFVMLSNSTTPQPEEWLRSVLYNDVYSKNKLKLYSFDLPLQGFEQRRLFLVTEYTNEKSYLELPSEELFGYCQHQSELVKVSHPFKNSIWLELIIPSQSVCQSRPGGRQVTRYGVLLKVKEGKITTLLDAIPIQQNEWQNLFSLDSERIVRRLNVTFLESSVVITKDTLEVTPEQKSWLGSFKIKQN